MMLITHALFGAALGRIAGHRPSAFLAGVASHALGDVLPHREFPLEADAPLVAAALAALGLRYGWTSPEFVGALGGITPDAEHLPTVLGWQTAEEEKFPTHGPAPQPWLHSMGRTPENNWVQVGLAFSALTVLCAGTQPNAGTPRLNAGEPLSERSESDRGNV